ncbi:MAG: glycosyltransferase, partial [Gammaproteobacteria bacterium]|nr:glycosyltransferase [Gammaproteobacteria bacterium]
MNVLHLTPHMGGGVGRALLGVASNVNNGIEHSFICLEKPEKKQFLEAIRELGCKVLVAPSRTKIIEQIEASDIVQLEWWRHPATIECLSHLSSISMRLVVWCHVSGLYNEIIPEQLLKSSARFLLTSACSLQSTQIQLLSSEEKERLAIVHSNGGLEAWPMSSACDEHEPLAVGYIGSLNFAKLHPNYVDFLASVAIDDFKISLIGDLTNQDVLQHQAISLNKPKLLNFVGYVEDVPTALSKINVLAYLQNPTHYGTNENALLEAMAMGIVPVVLNNPAE